MKIEKTDVVLILAYVVAGCIFMLFASNVALVSLIAGVHIGAGAGCVVCIFRRLIKRKHTEPT